MLKDYLDQPDIGYAILPDYMKKGYMFEITQAVVLFSKTQLKLIKLYTIVKAINLASIKLLLKLDFKENVSETIEINRVYSIKLIN